MDLFGLKGIPQGMVEALIAITIVTLPASLVFSRIPAASPQLLEQTANIGTVLVLAYVLEAVWLVPRFSQMDDYEQRLGAITGLGMAGMLGVVLALLSAAHRTAGHANWLDFMALGWAAPSLLFLGYLVVLQPLLVHEWEHPRRDRRESNRDG